MFSMEFREETETNWNVIPDILLVYIFHYLSDSDRSKAACVCKRWAQVFNSPCLWRDRVMKLGAVDTVEEVKALRFAEVFGGHLRQLTILCNKRCGNMRKRFQRVMCQILEKLNNRECQLKELNIPRMEFYRFWRFDFYREKLLKSVCKFLRCQNSLRTFDMHAARLNIYSGSELLDSVAIGSGPTLEVLNIEDFYHDRIQCFRVPKFVNTLRKFSNLSILYLNYSYISDIILYILADNCAGKLKHLSIKVQRKDPHFHVTERSSWLLLTNACPELGVAVEFDHIGGYRIISSILVPGIPLKYLQIWSGYDPLGVWRLESVVNHVQNNYWRSLELLSLEYDNPQEILHHALLSLVVRCRLLKSVDIHAFIDSAAIDILCNLQQQSKIALRRLHVCAHDTSDERQAEIHAIRDKYQTLLQTPNLDFRFLTDNIFEDDDEE